MIPPPPRSTLFPYTTLFRSIRKIGAFAGTAALAAPHRLLLHNRSEEHTSELQSHSDLVCRLLLEKKKQPLAVYLMLSLHRVHGLIINWRSTTRRKCAEKLHS